MKEEIERLEDYIITLEAKIKELEERVGGIKGNKVSYKLPNLARKPGFGEEADIGAADDAPF